MQAILFSATSEPASSRRFYEQILGFNFIEDTPFALVFDVDGTTLRVQKVEKVQAPPYTAIGFQVEDIAGEISRLNDQGVHCERYGFIEQDELGIWTTTDGASIAWFKDPDGNLISFSQHP